MMLRRSGHLPVAGRSGARFSLRPHRNRDPWRLEAELRFPSTGSPRAAARRDAGRRGRLARWSYRPSPEQFGAWADIVVLPVSANQKGYRQPKAVVERETSPASQRVDRRRKTAAEEISEAPRECLRDRGCSWSTYHSGEANGARDEVPPAERGRQLRRLQCRMIANTNTPTTR